MAAARPKNKIERAYTVKDIESDDLECTTISKLNMDIYTIDENEMETVSWYQMESIHINPGQKELN